MFVEQKCTWWSLYLQEIAYFDEPAHSTGALTARLATDATGVQGVGDMNFLFIATNPRYCLIVIHVSVEMFMRSYANAISTSSTIRVAFIS